MYLTLALALLIFSLSPASGQAGPVPGSQSVTIGISLTIPPKRDDERQLIKECVAVTDHEVRSNHLVTCRDNELSVSVANEQGGVNVRVIPI